MTGLSPRGFLSLTAALPLRVVEGALHLWKAPSYEKTFTTALIETSATCLQGGERTMRWRGRPPIGGQDSDRVSHPCSAPYTLLPLRGISPQGETRNLRRKIESHILHVPFRHSPFGGWRHHLSPSSRGHNNPCLL